MNEIERTAIFKVAGGRQENLPMIHSIHTKFKRGSQMIQFCVSSKIVGESFKRMCEDFGGNWMKIGNHILKRMDSEQNKKRSLQSKELKW